jgi:hypothetical protein
LASAATAVSAIGLLTGPVSAHALPPFPANAGCLQFKFMRYYEIGQNNGYNVHFVGSGQTAEGPAWARGPASDGSDDLTGTVSGGIQGRKMDFTIRWDSGSAGHYTADIDDEGFVEHGSTSEPGRSRVTLAVELAQSAGMRYAARHPPNPEHELTANSRRWRAVVCVSPSTLPRPGHQGPYDEHDCDLGQ